MCILLSLASLWSHSLIDLLAQEIHLSFFMVIIVSNLMGNECVCFFFFFGWLGVGGELMFYMCTPCSHPPPGASYSSIYIYARVLAHDGYSL